MKKFTEKYKYIYLDDYCDEKIKIIEDNKTIVIINNLSKENISSKLDISVLKNINIDIIDIYINNETSSHKKQITFNLGEKVKLRYYKIKELLFDSSLENSYSYKIGKNASLIMNLFELDSKNSSNHIKGKLDEINACIYINALIKLDKINEHLDLIHTSHENKRTTSELNFKYILNDKSKATFEAKTIVLKEAVFAQACQNANSILLNDKATFFSQPHLEILTSELKANHGTTTGSLDEQQLNYLLLKGIKEKEAKKLLLKAFEIEIYDKISENNIKDFILNFNRNDYV